LDELEGLAASETPNLAGAWWIAHQVSEHIFSAIGRRDPRTGAPLSCPLTQILEAIRQATAVGCRPFPNDQLFSAAQFAAKPIEQLLEHYRHRIVRVHKQLPFHQIRELDARSMSWLMHQPGRNAREKLSGRTHVLGVKRSITADTTENRLLQSFAKRFTKRANIRLSFVHAYDGNQNDKERVQMLTECVQLCDERMRRSELGAIPTLTRFQPNNVLLSDPLYSRVFLAWKWLRDEDDALYRSWPTVLHRVRSSLFWLTAARLAGTENIVVSDTLTRVVSNNVEYSSIGIEVLASENNSPAWHLNPALSFLLVSPNEKNFTFQIRIALEGECLLAHIDVFEGNGILIETTVSEISFEIQPDIEHIASGRGIGIYVKGLNSKIPGANKSYADIAGLRSLANHLARQILERCGVNQFVAKRRGTEFREVEDNAHIGLEFGSAALYLNDGQLLPVESGAWSATLRLPGGDQSVEWLDGCRGRHMAVGVANCSFWNMADVFEPDADADFGELVLAARRVVHSLAKELAWPVNARLAYTVPDSVDEFSQRTIRAAIGGFFSKALPVWRSIAGAMAWTFSPAFHTAGVQPGDHIIVVDTEFSSTTITILVARVDFDLERKRPESHGIYWERKPPLPSDESLEQLGWSNVLLAYARWLVDHYAGNALSAERQKIIVDDLVRTGVISTLTEFGSSVVVHTGTTLENKNDVLSLQHDHRYFLGLIDHWVERLKAAIENVLRPVGLPNKRSHLILLGGPCRNLKEKREERHTGRMKKDLLNKERGFGVIAGDNGTDVFMHFSAIGLSQFQALQVGDRVEFDVDDSNGKLQARQVSMCSNFDIWCRMDATPIPAQELALGARECLLRMDADCTAWKEWLPDLSLEVVRDGHYGELRLLGSDTLVDPSFGKAQEFLVPDGLTLPRGQNWYPFPLIIGRQGRRPLAWEAWLESPAFPLEHDVPVVLKLLYSYGLDTSYKLVLEPESKTNAPFTRIEAKWGKVGEITHSLPITEIPTFATASWESAFAEKFVDATKTMAKLNGQPLPRFLIPLTKSCWAQGRSLACAPESVRTAFLPFQEHLMKDVLSASPTVQQIPISLEILALVHEDAPKEVIEIILRLDNKAADDLPSFKKTSSLLRMVVGDGKGDRLAILERLFDRLKRHSQIDTFDPALIGWTINTLATAVWRHPGLIPSIAAIHDAVDLLIDRCRISLQNLLAQVPNDISTNEDRDSISKRYARPYVDDCELLLAILRLGESTSIIWTLRQGSASATALAKMVRQLDARFTSAKIELRWRVQVAVFMPESLSRMSPLAFALNSYLTEGAGGNLIQVTEIQSD
jgi:cold shock CspA family protein